MLGHAITELGHRDFHFDCLHVHGALVHLGAQLLLGDPAEFPKQKGIDLGGLRVRLLDTELGQIFLVMVSNANNEARSVALILFQELH